MDAFGRLDPGSVDVNPNGSTFLKSRVTNTICLGYGDEATLGSHCKIHRRPKSCARVDQAGATLLGPVTSMSWVCRSCGCNAHNAMCNRHGLTRPVPTSAFSFANDYIDDSLNEIEHYYNTHYETHAHEWLLKWPQVKQAAILKSQAFDELAPGRVKNMVKREAQHTVPKKARCIQFYPNLATQAEFGPEFTSLQKAVCRTWRRRAMGGVRVTVASEMNSKAMGEWMTETLADYANPKFYERDGKAWDATMGRIHHDLKMRAYGRMPARFKKFVEDCYKVRGCGVYRDGSILAYEVEGTVKSGHNDTTLGNCIVNAMIAAEACVRLGLTADIIVVGDDLLIIIEGDFDEHALAREEASLGIRPEYRKFEDVEDVSFISAQWVTLPGGRYIFVPKLGRLLARLHWTVNPPAMKNLDSYLRGVYSGLSATCHSIPVYSALCPVTKGKIMEVDRWRREMYGTETVCYTREEVMPWFLRKYHCSVHEVEQLETELADRTPRVIRSSLIDRIDAVDCADIDVRMCVRN